MTDKPTCPRCYQSSRVKELSDSRFSCDNHELVVWTTPDPNSLLRADQLRMYALEKAVSNRPITGSMSTGPLSQSAEQITDTATKFYAFLTGND